jgi:hypothetical protein
MMSIALNVGTALFCLTFLLSVMFILYDELPDMQRICLGGLAGFIFMNAWYAAMGHSKTDIWAVLGFRFFLTGLIWSIYQKRAHRVLLEKLAPKWIRGLLTDALRSAPYSSRRGPGE